MTNRIYGDSNTNVGNVSNSYNNTINVGMDKESLLIHEWLSPLEPHKRHQDVRNHRVDGVGEWVLRRMVLVNGFCGEVNSSHDARLRTA